MKDSTGNIARKLKWVKMDPPAAVKLIKARFFPFTEYPWMAGSKGTRMMQSLKTVIVATTIAVAGLTHAASTSQTISTELNEVRAGNFDGIEYLDLHISSQVGPVTCRNNVVSVNVEKYTEKTDHDIEVIALQAMVKSEAVLITVQLAKDDCIDGKPLVSELKVLPRSTHF